VLESSDGYAITVVDANEYSFTSTGTATTGDTTGGGDKATAGTAFIPTVTGVAAVGSINSATVAVPDSSSTVSGLTGTGSVGSVTATGAASSFTNYTVTVATGTNSYGTGNKFYVDGSVSPTLNLTEGQIYRFDQSDSTNSTHPLRFSTTANGTHAGGSEYTTGVTTAGTPGSSGAYTQIEVASGAPTLYYYCTNHSGMGGQINT